MKKELDQHEKDVIIGDISKVLKDLWAGNKLLRVTFIENDLSYGDCIEITCGNYLAYSEDVMITWDIEGDDFMVVWVRDQNGEQGRTQIHEYDKSLTKYKSTSGSSLSDMTVQLNQSQSRASQAKRMWHHRGRHIKSIQDKIVATANLYVGLTFIGSNKIKFNK